MTDQPLTIRASRALAVLERIARRQSFPRIARELALPASVVEAVAVKFGHPSVPQMRAAHRQLEALGDELVSYAGTDPTGEHTEPRFELEAAAGESPAQLIEAAVRALTVDQLLERAAASGRGSVRADSARAAALLERIRRSLIDDELTARTRARVAELRRELAQLEGAAPRSRHECPVPGCNYSTVQSARFATHTATHEETTHA